MKDEYSFKEILLLGTGYAIPIWMGLSALYNESGAGIGLLVVFAFIFAIVYAVLLLVILVCVSFTEKGKNMEEGVLVWSYLIFIVHLIICLVIGSLRFT